MAIHFSSKVVSALPATLVANTVYYVRVGKGFDLYVTNSTGTIVAYPLNAALGVNLEMTADVVTSSAAGVNLSEHTLDVIAGSTYKFDLNLAFLTGGVLNGIGISFAALNGAAGTLSAQALIPNGLGGIYAGDIQGLGTYATSGAALGSRGLARVCGYFKCTTSGKIVPKVKPGGLGSITAYAGSIFSARRF
jgi:hypothetical protein